MANGATSTGGPGTKNISLSGPFASGYTDLSGLQDNSIARNPKSITGPNTSVVYSGSDVFAYITPYAANITNTPFIPLKNLITFSYSTHRDKLPVRKLGSPVAFDYTKGTRTIAGAIVMLNFDRAAFSDLIMGSDIYGGEQQINMFDEIPPFDITLLFSSELESDWKNSGNFLSNTYSVLEIKGIRLTDEGLVTGTNEAYLETTFQYLAEDISYLAPMRLTPPPRPKVPVAGIDDEFFDEDITVEDTEMDSFDNWEIAPPFPYSDLPRIAPAGVMGADRIFDTCSDDNSFGPESAIIECYVSTVWSTYTHGGIGTKLAGWHSIGGGEIDLAVTPAYQPQSGDKPLYAPLVLFPVVKAEWEYLQGVTGGIGSHAKEEIVPGLHQTTDAAYESARTTFATYCQEAYDGTSVIFSGCAGT